MFRMIFGGMLICGAFGLSFLEWTPATLLSLIVGFCGAVMFFWGFLKGYRSKKKG